MQEQGGEREYSEHEFELVNSTVEIQEDSQLFRELIAIYTVMPQETIIMCLKKDE